MSVSIGRIIEKLDSLLDAKDFDGAERHLKYWVAEAQSVGDKRAVLSLLNEQIGFYRKNGRREDCFTVCVETDRLVSELGLSDSVSGATSYLNIATGYKSFDENDKALLYYEKALLLYERDLPDNDSRLGGLYNNMAIALTAKGDFMRAEGMYKKAISVISQYASFKPEEAVTYLNMTDLLYAADFTDDTIEKAEVYIKRAMELLEDESIDRNGDYAFVIEKCYPVFEHYGYFDYAATLKERAAEIYEGLKK